MVKNILVLDDGTEIAAGTVGQNAIRSLICTETVSKTTDLCPGAACSNKLEITIWVEPGPTTGRHPAIEPWRAPTGQLNLPARPATPIKYTLMTLYPGLIAYSLPGCDPFRISFR